MMDELMQRLQSRYSAYKAHQEDQPTDDDQIVEWWLWMGKEMSLRTDIAVTVADLFLMLVPPQNEHRARR